jgi:uncharacterized protein (DUF1800 family)
MRPGKFRFRRLRVVGDGVTTLVLGTVLISLVVAPLHAADLGESALLPPPPARAWKERQSGDQAILHLLNRITFGPGPGDVERVRARGLKAFLNEQLHPELIQDLEVEAKLASLPTLSMTAAELVENFPAPKPAQQLKRQAATKPPADPAVPARRVVEPGAAPQRQMDPPGPDAPRLEGPQEVLFELGREELWRAVYSRRQLQEEMVQFWMNHFNIFAGKGADRWLLTSFEREVVRPHTLDKFENLLIATAESPAMLFYLDNWMSATPNPANHPGRGEPAPNSGGSQVLREPHGRLGQSGIGEPGPAEGVPPGKQPQTQPRAGNVPRPNLRRGLNENYARELMELHTLGVDGGYTQQDVIEVARCFTGWTIDRPRQGGGFTFNPRMHDFGPKVVLGHKIEAGRGIEDGLEVLHLLAQHPSTAHFISLELCRRFVADDPPASVVDRAGKTFLKTNGDIRAVLKTILTSREFYSQSAYRAKVKSPLELVASSLRALGGDTDAGAPLMMALARMGLPMFQYQAPSGYPDRADSWINSNALLARMNFATLLASNHFRGTHVDPGRFVQEGAFPEVVVDELARGLLAEPVSRQTKGAILQQISAPATTNAATQQEVAKMTALLLASPEFQRR